MIAFAQAGGRTLCHTIRAAAVPIPSAINLFYQVSNQRRYPGRRSGRLQYVGHPGFLRATNYPNRVWQMGGNGGMVVHHGRECSTDRVWRRPKKRSL